MHKHIYKPCVSAAIIKHRYCLRPKSNISFPKSNIHQLEIPAFFSLFLSEPNFRFRNRPTYRCPRFLTVGAERRGKAYN